MSKIMNWIRENKTISIIFLVLVFILPLGITQLLFSINAPYPWLISLWDSGDFLAYAGSFMSFIGSVFLGYVAISQSEEANRLNKNLQKIQESTFISMISIAQLESNIGQQPHFCNPRFRDIDVELDLRIKGDQLTPCCVDVEISNDSEYPLVELRAIIENQINNAKVVHSDIYVPKKNSKKFRFILPLPHDRANLDKYNLMLDFTNIFDYRTSASLTVNIDYQIGRANEYAFRLRKMSVM